jgi:hypothetical protein
VPSSFQVHPQQVGQHALVGFLAQLGQFAHFGERQIHKAEYYALLLFAAAAMVAPPAGADVQPGDVITKANVDKVKDLISPGVEWCVEHGMTMKIDLRHDQLPDPLVDAFVDVNHHMVELEKRMLALEEERRKEK